MILLANCVEQIAEIAMRDFRQFGRCNSPGPYLLRRFASCSRDDLR